MSASDFVYAITSLLESPEGIKDSNEMKNYQSGPQKEIVTNLGKNRTATARPNTPSGETAGCRCIANIAAARARCCRRILRAPLGNREPTRCRAKTKESGH